MADTYTAEPFIMICSVEQCPGRYEHRTIVHTVRHEGELLIIDGVPADVCDTCGDVLFDPGTLRRIEVILQQLGRPSRTVPLYEFA